MSCNGWLNASEKKKTFPKSNKNVISFIQKKELLPAPTFSFNLEQRSITDYFNKPKPKKLVAKVQELTKTEKKLETNCKLVTSDGSLWKFTSITNEVTKIGCTKVNAESPAQNCNSNNTKKDERNDLIMKDNLMSLHTNKKPLIPTDEPELKQTVTKPVYELHKNKPLIPVEPELKQNVPKPVYELRINRQATLKPFVPIPMDPDCPKLNLNNLQIKPFIPLPTDQYKLAFVD